MYPIASTTTPMTAHSAESKLFFDLSETHSGHEAARHQRFIEREGPCIASLGTLPATEAERHRVWDAIDRRATRQRGWIELGRVDDGLRLKELEKVLRKCVAEGRVDDAAVARWRDGARQCLTGTAEKNLPQDWKCKVWTRDATDHATMRAVVRAVCGERRSETADPLKVKYRKPRASIVQRRLTMELAQELGIDCQEDIVRKWCESNLAEVSWHACIHRVSDGPDVWRDTAYIVYTQFEIKPERDDQGWATGWWTFERDEGLPPPAAMVKVLWGKGAGELIRRWRTDLAELQNERLEAESVDRRYGSSAHRHGGAVAVAPARSAQAQGRGGVESSSTAGLSSKQELGAVQAVEPWHESWRDALVDVPEGDRVGRIAASIVGKWSADEKRRWERDPRPDVRALCAHARRWRSETSQWRQKVERICDTWCTHPTAMAEVEALVEELGVHGIGVRAIATREQQRSLVQARRCDRAVKAAKAAIDATRVALTSEQIDAIVKKWDDRYPRTKNACAACEAHAKGLKDAAKSRRKRTGGTGAPGAA